MVEISAGRFQEKHGTPSFLFTHFCSRSRYHLISNTSNAEHRVSLLWSFSHRESGTTRNAGSMLLSRKQRWRRLCRPHSVDPSLAIWGSGNFDDLLRRSKSTSEILCKGRYGRMYSDGGGDSNGKDCMCIMSWYNAAALYLPRGCVRANVRARHQG